MSTTALDRWTRLLVFATAVIGTVEAIVSLAGVCSSAPLAVTAVACLIAVAIIVKMG